MNTKPMTLMEAVVTALRNGNEGGYAANWDQDDAASGFWIPYEDYQNIIIIIAKAEGQAALSPHEEKK